MPETYKTLVAGTNVARSRPRMDDVSLFRGAHPHALLIGPAASADAALGRLLPHLRAPLSHWRPQVAGEPPQETTGTLVIWDVDALDRTRQEQLLE